MQYYMHIGGQQMGPFEENQLVANGLTLTTPVWCEGMANWAPASQVPALAHLFTASQPPVYGQPLQSQQPQPPMPKTNLVWAVLVTLFCCLPFGVVSIVKAAQVSEHYNNGRYEEAEKASKSAGQWALWGALVGFIVSIIYGGIIALCNLHNL